MTDRSRVPNTYLRVEIRHARDRWYIQASWHAATGEHLGRISLDQTRFLPYDQVPPTAVLTEVIRAAAAAFEDSEHGETTGA